MNMKAIACVIGVACAGVLLASCASPSAVGGYEYPQFGSPAPSYTPAVPRAAVAPRSTIEAVAVLKVMDTDYKAIIQRGNGEMYLVEYGIGVISIWRYEGKVVLIHSPGLFCGVGSSIILPDEDQKARIWNAEQIQQ